jgi:hypothetical protein
MPRSLRPDRRRRPIIVEIAGHLVPTRTAATFDLYAADLASDLTVWIDGKEIAASKASWLAQERHRLGKVDRHVLGYVPGYDSILVFDQFDDRSDVRDGPNAVYDARYKTRALRYRVGPDHLVHEIRIVEADGIMHAAAQ